MFGHLEAFLTGFWNWIPSWKCLEEVAKLAPIGTATVAAAAFFVAWQSLRTQKSIARKRAAIDVFLKTEMDRTMLDAYSKYEEALEELDKANSIEGFCRDNREKCEAIRTYLNVNELIAIGINRKVFDEEVCFNFWSDLLVNIRHRSGEIIEKDRKEEGSGETYSDLIVLAERWAKRIKRAKG